MNSTLLIYYRLNPAEIPTFSLKTVNWMTFNQLVANDNRQAPHKAVQSAALILPFPWIRPQI